MFEPVIHSSILKRAQQKNKVSFELVDLRQFGLGVHKVVDDSPYGGSAGMVLKADVLASALNSLPLMHDKERSQVILTTASGKPFIQKTARGLSKLDEVALIWGHYEGVDQRFIDR